jgi:hypothetical protein
VREKSSLFVGLEDNRTRILKALNVSEDQDGLEQPASFTHSLSGLRKKAGGLIETKKKEIRDQ